MYWISLHLVFQILNLNLKTSPVFFYCWTSSIFHLKEHLKLSIRVLCFCGLRSRFDSIRRVVCLHNQLGLQASCQIKRESVIIATKQKARFVRVSATPGTDLAVNKAQSFLRATFRSRAISVEKRFDFACDGSMCQDLTKALSIFERCIIRRCGRLALWKTCSLCGNFQVELGSNGATDKSSNYWVCSRWLYTIVTETANINRLYWGNLSERPLSVSLNHVGFF